MPSLRTLKRRFFDGPALLNYPGRRERRWKPLAMHFSNWIYAFFVRRFTVAGGLLLAVTSVITGGGSASMLMPLFLFSILLTALFLANIAIGFLLRPKLTILRALPTSVMEGEKARIGYRIRNIGERPAWDVLVDHIPVNPLIRIPEGRPYLAELQPGEDAEMSAEFQVERRGVYHFPLPVADTAFPLGLWRWGNTGLPNPAVVVTPRFPRITNLPILSSDAWSDGRQLASAKPGQSLEFLGCREFRFGDSTRHLHPLSWARRGVPVVKEYANELGGDCGVFLDVFCSKLDAPWQGLKPESKRLSASVSLAAGICSQLTGRNCVIQLHFHEDTHEKEIPLVTRRDLETELPCLEALAAVQFLTDSPRELSDDELDVLSQTPSFYLLVHRWQDRHEALVDALQARRVTVYPILCSDTGQATCPDYVTQVSAAEVQSEEPLDLKP